MFSFFKPYFSSWLPNTDNQNGKFKFIDSDAQRKEITEILTNFKKARDIVLDIDSKVAKGALAGGLLLLFRFIGTLTAAAVASLLVYFLLPFDKRKTNYAEMQLQKEKLIEIYYHCLESDFAEIENNTTFLDVLDAIAPFMKTKELKLEKLNLTSNVSPRLAEILWSSHNIQIAGISPTLKEALANKNAGLFDPFILFGKRTLYGSGITPDIQDMARKLTLN